MGVCALLVRKSRGRGNRSTHLSWTCLGCELSLRIVRGEAKHPANDFVGVRRLPLAPTTPSGSRVRHGFAFGPLKSLYMTVYVWKSATKLLFKTHTYNTNTAILLQSMSKIEKTNSVHVRRNSHPTVP